MKLETVVEISLLAFAYIFTGIVLFGLIGAETRSSQALILFKISFFILTLIILGIVLLTNRHQLQGIPEHIVAIALILILSVSFAQSAGNLKDAYEKVKTGPATKLQKEVSALEAQNAFYISYFSSLANHTMVLHDNTLLLQDQIKNLEAKIATMDAAASAAPVIIQPPVQQPPVQQVPKQPRKNDDDYEVDDD
jgi:hypothetical protein